MSNEKKILERAQADLRLASDKAEDTMRSLEKVMGAESARAIIDVVLATGVFEAAVHNLAAIVAHIDPENGPMQ